MHAVRDGVADALVSAGATGATVTAAALGLGRWPGVRRPALAAILPAVAGPVVLLDVGGSLEPRPATLARTPRSAPPTPRSRTASPRPGSACSRSAPSRARATGSPRRRAALAATSLPCDGRYVGLVEGYDVVPRRARRRGGHRRVHR